MWIQRVKRRPQQQFVAPHDVDFYVDPMRFPSAPLSVYLSVLRENHSRSGHPPMTPVKCTAMTASMMEFPDAMELVTDVLIMGGAC